MRFVDQGLMRKTKATLLKNIHKPFDMNFVRVNCGDVFLEKLKGVVDPEQKRKLSVLNF